jgi:hypothetical protein
MTTAMRAFRSITALMALSLAARAARADLLTADQAVQLALQHGPDVQLAGANVLDAKSRRAAARHRQRRAQQ